MVGMWTAGRRGMKIGLSPEDISNLMLWIFIGGIAGAKLLYVANHWNGEEPLKDLILQRSGMVFHGALFGTAIAVWLFTRKTKMPLWATLDTLAPSFALGHAFGRIGCFMTSCCYGKTCDLPWSVRFPTGSNPHIGHTRGSEYWLDMLKQSAEQVPSQLTRNIQELVVYFKSTTHTSAEVYASAKQKMVLLSRGKTNVVIEPIEQKTYDVVHSLNIHAPYPLSIHPTQIYEGLLLLALFASLAWLFRNRKFNGQIFASYLIGYALLRFGMEFLRADGRGHLWFGKLTSGQGISIILIIGGVMIWRFLSNREKLPMEEPE